MLKKLRDWHARSKLRSLVRWEQVRTKGKAQFVARATLTYNAIAIPTYGFVTYLFDGEMQSWQSGHFWFKAAGYSLTGVVVGIVSWASMERQYKQALLDGRIVAAIKPPRDHALLQNSKSDPLSIDLSEHPKPTGKALT